MENKKMVTINKLDGTKEEVEVIIVFQFNDTKKEYMVYTKNEMDDSGNITVASGTNSFGKLLAVSADGKEIQVFIK